MFTNIEKKIKIMALVVPAVILLSSLIMTIMIWVGGSRIIGVTGLGYSSYGSDAGGSVFLIGFLVLLFGALTAVLTCFLLYGFGELIEQTRWQAQSMGNLTGTPMPEPFVLQRTRQQPQPQYPPQPYPQQPQYTPAPQQPAPRQAAPYQGSRLQKQQTGAYAPQGEYRPQQPASGRPQAGYPEQEPPRPRRNTPEA